MVEPSHYSLGVCVRNFIISYTRVFQLQFIRHGFSLRRHELLICMCPVCAGDRCQSRAVHLAEAKHGHSRLDGPSGICVGVLCQADTCGAACCSAWHRIQNCQPVHCDAAGYPRPVCRRGEQQSTLPPFVCLCASCAACLRHHYYWPMQQD